MPEQTALEVTSSPDFYRAQRDIKSRQIASDLTHEFRFKLASELCPRHLYALTVAPKYHLMRDCFNDDSERETRVHRIYTALEHQISSYICPNYRRNTHKNNRIFSLGFIEHESKQHTAFVNTHVHSTIAVADDWKRLFDDLLVRVDSDNFKFNLRKFRNESARRLEADIQSTMIKPISSAEDLLKWNRYSAKFLDKRTTPFTSNIH